MCVCMCVCDAVDILPPPFLVAGTRVPNTKQRHLRRGGCHLVLVRLVGDFFEQVLLFALLFAYFVLIWCGWKGQVSHRDRSSDTRLI